MKFWHRMSSETRLVVLAVVVLLAMAFAIHWLDR